MVKILCSVLVLLASFTALSCEFEKVTFGDNFSMGKLDGCKQVNSHYFQLTFKPENRPINSSAWYAFSMASTEPTTITLSLTFDGDLPRYLPKKQLSDGQWQSIPFKLIDKTIQIQLDANRTPTLVAGQEIINNQAYVAWIETVTTKSHLSEQIEVFELGKSTQLRPIHGIKSLAPDSNEWVLLIGRQHPPEITGVLAMLPFVEQLLGDSKQALAFRSRFNILVVPNLNPDGVEHGYWRHNINGVDLNRDWNKFEQVETRLIRDFLKELVSKQQKLVFALDFHSTLEDVFYTMPVDVGVVPEDLVIHWLNDIHFASNRMFKVRNKPGNSPGRGIFKQFIADTYKVHAVTYEIGDTTNRFLIPEIAKVSADTLMDRLLKTDKADFYVEDEKAK